MESDIEILVIDDHIATAQSYADLIEARCSLKAVATSDIESAVQYVTKSPIKVVVLDQKMPILGTEVFKKLIRINPFLKVIMVSGEASYADAVTAGQLGLLEHLHKKDIKKLPERIFKLRAEYEIGITRHIRTSKPFYIKWKFSLFSICRIEYYLLNYTVVNKNFIQESEWKTLEKINQGERQYKEIIIELKIKDEISVSKESITQYKNAASINHKLVLSKLDAALSGSMSLSLAHHASSSRETTKTIQKKIELSLLEGEAIDGKKIISKNYEANQVYEQILLHIRKACCLCREHVVFPMMVYKPINKKVFRLITYTDDNRSHVTDMGDFVW